MAICDAVGACDAFDDLRQLVRVLQAAPRLRGGLNELEDHELRHLLRQGALGPDRPMSDGGEDALDRIAGAQVVPVLGGEGVEGQQRLAVLRQAGHRLLVLV